MEIAEEQAQQDVESSEFANAFAEAARAKAETAEVVDRESDDPVAEPPPDDGGEPDEGDDEGRPAPDLWAEASEAHRTAYQAALAEQERLRHSVHSNAGRVSALQRKINELESQLGRQISAAAAPTEAPSAQEIKDAMQTPESWASFSEEYPEVAKAVDGRIAGEIARLEQALNPLREDVQRRHQIEAKQFEQSQYAAVERAHPQWRKTINTPEFSEWLQRQPVSIQTLVESDYADDAIALLDFFTGSRERGAPVQGRVSEIQAARQRRLEQSIETPSRRGAQRPLAEDDFSSAFKAAAAKKLRGSF